MRARWCARNFSESFLLDAVLAGEVALPAGRTKEPFIDAEDIADVVVEALRRKPDLSLAYLEKTLPTKHPGGLALYLDGLRKAGLE